MALLAWCVAAVVAAVGLVAVVTAVRTVMARDVDSHDASSLNRDGWGS